MCLVSLQSVSHRLKACWKRGCSCVHDQLMNYLYRYSRSGTRKKTNSVPGHPQRNNSQHDPKANDDAHERAAHVYQNVPLHMDSGSRPQGEVFWPNYPEKVSAVDNPAAARALARQSPGRAGLQVYFGHTRFCGAICTCKTMHAV